MEASEIAVNTMIRPTDLFIAWNINGRWITVAMRKFRRASAPRANCGPSS
jgi:hypothetical protein